MNEHELQNAVARGLSVRQIARDFSCSPSNARYWLRKHQLETEPRIVRACGQCGESDPARFYGHKKRICGPCHNSYTLQRGQEIKQRARELLGGKCCCCGFATYQVSLDVHHLDPARKAPNFETMRGWSWPRVERELATCALLCKNCHAAVHAGLLNVPT